MKFDPEMQIVKKQLEDLGHEVQKPNVVEGHVYEDNLDENAALKRGFIDQHFRKIDESEAIVVVNPEKNGVPNYIGGNSLIEIAYAYSQGLEIFILHGMPHVSYADEIRGMNPIVLDGSIKKLDEHIKALPFVFMSTESPVKHLAVSRGLRRAGIKVRVGGKKVDSGVNEQPLSIDETYEGAMNRHAHLKELEHPAEYYVTIESGQHLTHKNHNMFGSSVTILEKAGEKEHVGIDMDIEFPSDMLDKVPSQYPDLGVLVQQEYGSKLKDPYPYFTNGRLTRAKILENAVFNVAVRL
jgi:non-canonical (house-cleaning) NTP pyrophosphatase